MTTARATRLRLAGVVTVFAAAGALGLLSERGPAPAFAAQKDDKKYPRPADGPFELYSASNCKTCHNQKDPMAEQEYKDTRGYEFVRLWENRVWSAHDLHRTAYYNLLTAESKDVKEGKQDENGEKLKANPTAQRMENNLRQAGTDPKYKAPGYLVSTDTQCLACHASTLAPIADSPPKNWKLESFALDEGVGCEMCHGHGSKYAEEHKRNRLAKGDGPPDAKRVVPWREFPTSVKREWGLVNLRDPATATARCASCHIGNLAEGRFVTHDMYAAGHPPLPPLDLMAYTREQPQHWGLPSELPYFTWLTKNHPEKAESVFHVRAGESHAVRRFAESTIAALHSAAVLTGQLAEASKEEGLDYAAFDCASCHHNLKYPSDRQDRGYTGKPGRPLFRPATFALTRVMMEHAAQMPNGGDLKGALDSLAAVEKTLAEAFTSKSLGDPAKVKAASAELSKWSADTLKKLAAVRYTPEEAKNLVAKIKEAAQKPIADPEVAQLYTWAFETLVLDLIPPKKDDKGNRVAPAEVTQLRDKLKDIVVTRLRPHAAFHYEVQGGTPGPTVEPVDARIGKRMEIFNSFQAAPFKKAFQEAKPFGK